MIAVFLVLRVSFVPFRHKIAPLYMQADKCVVNILKTCVYRKEQLATRINTIP